MPGGGQFSHAGLRNKGAPSALPAIAFCNRPDARSGRPGGAHFNEYSSAGNGKAAAEPPCRLEGLAFDVVE
jgi:hypothetical protein